MENKNPYQWLFNEFKKGYRSIPIEVKTLIKRVGQLLDKLASLKVLDKHIKTSLYLGNNEYGHPDFDTTRSELGEFIYDIKYNHTYINKLSNKEILPIDLYERFRKITEKEIKDFIEGKDINYLIGAPSSND